MDGLIVVDQRLKRVQCYFFILVLLVSIRAEMFQLRVWWAKNRRTIFLSSHLHFSVSFQTFNLKLQLGKFSFHPSCIFKVPRRTWRLGNLFNSSIKITNYKKSFFVKSFFVEHSQQSLETSTISFTKCFPKTKHPPEFLVKLKIFFTRVGFVMTSLRMLEIYWSFVDS